MGNFKHGMRPQGNASKTYAAWVSMRNRCLRPNDHAYPQYGGRGITICPEWNDFPRFFSDMGEAPKRKSLDRIDNNAGYFKENCRWATSTEQMQNRRCNKNITYNGETHCKAEWARRAGITRTRFGIRLKEGWSMERILSTPAVNGRNQFGLSARCKP